MKLTVRVFHFHLRLEKEMLESVFGDSITVSSNYTFHAPFKKYFPPLVSKADHGNYEKKFLVRLKEIITHTQEIKQKV